MSSIEDDQLQGDTIALAIFLKFREICKNIPESIKLKADTLQKSFTCFQENQDTRQHISKNDSKWTRNNAQQRPSQPRSQLSTRTEKPFIGVSREISKEERIKRDFMGFINKLSEGNRKNISLYFENNLQISYIEIYVRLLWEAMLRSEDFQNLYIECLEEISKKCENQDEINTKLTDIWIIYVNDKKWLPIESLINEQDYDDFCDFVKWKKTSITYIQGFSKCIVKSWLTDTLYDDLLRELIDSIHIFFINSPEGCKVIDALLDQLLIVLEHTNKLQDEPVHIFIFSLEDNVPTFRPSTRFKIYDIKEFLNRKFKYCVKSKN
jgi:hypothetical protein